ncbi:hypothetical protein INT47_003868 [Mucor saturninus]|uniref:Uncharacterized protein n=1 Tax=Mucor saturninus TaxID=64648 RepID=A0A8H7R0H4_9FUNG|nr:hypothetical protein INT47_003868 [Mucor saturninus]
MEIAQHETTTHVDKSNIRGPNNTLRIIFLTLCLAGLQFTWTVEMAYGTPYLLSLGLSKSNMSLVWIAGPLSGLIMQPVVGVISDSCKSKWGRRRPFLVGGSIIVVLSLLVIGWTREITHLLTRSDSGSLFKTVSIVIAIASIYILDFSVNCVQASCRALIVDALPTSQQEDGTAWAGRMVGLGSVAGYFMGYADLVKLFPFFGNTQLKVLCVFAVFVLMLCNFITCYAVRERVHVDDKVTGSVYQVFADIFHHIWHLPAPIQTICNVQFFAWIGWFPFLFYSTTWVAEIFERNLTEEMQDPVGQATRAGSFAFLIFSLISLSASFIIPLIVTPSDPNAQDTVWFGKKEYTLRFMRWKWLTLPRAWTASHFIFCISMMSTLFVSDVTAAAIVIGCCGVSWAISMWAPFSLLGEYVSAQEARHGIYQPVDTEEEIEMLGVGQTSSSPEQEEEEGGEEKSESPAAGVLLGIHNMYIVLPQFLVTFLSSFIFRLFDTVDNKTDTIGLVLRIGAVMAGVAGFISHRTTTS